MFINALPNMQLRPGKWYCCLFPCAPISCMIHEPRSPYLSVNVCLHIACYIVLSPKDH